MRASLHAAQRTQLRFTPSVQLALEFLQLPALELQALLDREVTANPLLEVDDDVYDSRELADESTSNAAPEVSPASVGEGIDAGSGAAVDSAGPATPPEATSASRDEAVTSDREPAGNERLDLPGSESAADSAADRSETDDLDDDWSSDWLGSGDGDPPLPQAYREVTEGSGMPEAASPPSLREALHRQLRLECRDAELCALGEYLLGCLDERGYLGLPLAEIAEAIPAPRARLEEALSCVQALDPAGIAARDLRECLYLQLARRGEAQTLAGRIVREHFDRLAHRRHVELSRHLHVTIQEVEAAIDVIRALEPHPGWLVAAEEVRYIFPELVVVQVGEGYEVYPSDRGVPRLRVAECYRAWVVDSRIDGDETRRYLQDKLRSARWLIQALDRRRDTMLRVMRAIVEEQEAFFEKGLEALRPITLQTIARRVGLHESTVARVTKDKYVQTPRGILPLKFFFSSRIPTQLGVDASSRAVRERIRQLVLDEDRTCPLSDAALAHILEREGVRIARRTVAKYRDQLGIERTQLRRRRDPDCGDSTPARDERRRIA